MWAQDDVLHVVWRGRAERAVAAGGIDGELWPVPGTGDLWELSLRLRRLDEAVVGVFVVALTGPDGAPPHPGPPAAQRIWRGSAAPAGPDRHPERIVVRGTHTTADLPGPARGGTRTVEAYLPPDTDGPLPVCLLADGQSTLVVASLLEDAVAGGALDPVVVLGIHSAHEPPPGDGLHDGRGREYVPGADRRRFDAHLRWVTDVVLPSLADGPAAGRADPARVVAAGFSNGAAWAIGAAQRRPDLFAGVVALSPGVVPARVRRGAHVPTYVAAGLYEPGFLRAARSWTGRLARAGVPHRHEEWVGGHDMEHWAQRLPLGLAHVLTEASVDRRTGRR